MGAKSLFSFILFVAVLSPAALDQPSRFNWEESKTRCSSKPQQEDIVYANDFSWGVTKEEMAKTFNSLYKSGKRLADRAYYSEEDSHFVVPHYNTDKKVRLPQHFIQSITHHIEKALERGYVDFAFFPDMGHAHFFIPKKFYDEKISHLKKQEKAYEMMISNPQIKILYHTAEQLKMQDKDRKLLKEYYAQRRYYTRNIVGNNNADARVDIIFAKDTKRFNSAHNYPGMKYWGAGFDIHSTSEGCFPYNYKGQTYYFDLSLKSLPYKPSDNDDWSQ